MNDAETITHHEWLERHAHCSIRDHAEFVEKALAERDDLREAASCLGEEIAAAGRYLPAEYCEMPHAPAVQRLRAERDELRAQYDGLREVYECGDCHAAYPAICDLHEALQTAEERAVDRQLESNDD